MSPTPKPGSDDALDKGCRCAVIDNHHGRGRYGDAEKYGWVITVGCPLHGNAFDYLHTLAGQVTAEEGQ